MSTNDNNLSGSGGVLVNLGCGSRIHGDWCNLDLHVSAPGVVACDLSKGIPLRDASASAVYSAAVLEHIRRSDLPAVLAECFRILKPGGVIRIAVPDFRRQAEAYLHALNRVESGDPGAVADHEWMVIEIIDQIGREKSGGAMAAFFGNGGVSNLNFILERIGAEGRELAESLADCRISGTIDLQESRRALVRGGRFGRLLLRWLLRSCNLERDLAALEVGRFRLCSGEVHQWVYDAWSLRQVLESAGFQRLQVCEHGCSRIPNWNGFHLEIDADGVVQKPDLLIMEGEKVR